MARIGEQAFYELDAPLARVCSQEVPIPYAAHLEQAALPQVAQIVAAARQQLGLPTLVPHANQNPNPGLQGGAA
jgi:pyruvate/2-oxoglutarate/acetoin dehydrogenase E1 component